MRNSSYVWWWLKDTESQGIHSFVDNWSRDKGDSLCVVTLLKNWLEIHIDARMENPLQVTSYPAIISPSFWDTIQSNVMENGILSSNVASTYHEDGTVYVEADTHDADPDRFFYSRTMDVHHSDAPYLLLTS